LLELGGKLLRLAGRTIMEVRKTNVQGWEPVGKYTAGENNAPEAETGRRLDNNSIKGLWEER